MHKVTRSREHQPMSHANRGWERLTDYIISTINTQKDGVVFLLWGGHAQKKASFVDQKKHAILKTAHPSPLSAQRFFGCKHFSLCNNALRQKGEPEIDWRLDL